MICKGYWISFIVWFIVDFLDISQGSKLSELELSNQTSFSSIEDDNSTEDIRECLNITGHSFQNGMEFIPQGVDFCKLCICEDGLAKKCRAILCTPPSCKSFQMGLLCCQFTCLDDLDELDSALTSTTTEIGILPTSNSVTVKVSFSLLFIIFFNSIQNFCTRF